jgi:hypothetical protein
MMKIIIQVRTTLPKHLNHGQDQPLSRENVSLGPHVSLPLCNSVRVTQIAGHRES